MSAHRPSSVDRPCALRSRPAGRAGQHGFTMIELTVALVAGLVVAMGIVGLSREATRTFNDEMRSSAAEGVLRAAIERLRNDLQRAGFMSTGNILSDPSMALVPGSLAGSGNAVAYKPTTATPTGIGMSGLQNLASIYWLDNGSNGGGAGSVNNNLTLSANQTAEVFTGYTQVALTPDLIQIAGNMTTTEQFDVQYMVPGTNTPCGSGGTKISLSANAPSMVRALGGVAPTAANAGTLGPILQNLFTPDGQSSFLLRLIDRTAHSQYLAVCPPSSAYPSAGIDGNGQPYVLVDGANTPILFSSATGTTSMLGGVSGFCAGCVLNPVQIVEWEITNSNGGATHNEPSSDTTSPLGFLSLTKTNDSYKYDLMRTYLDSGGNFLGGTSEIVAEYAVDLAFAFTGDTGTSASPAAINTTTSCALDDNTTPSCNARWAQQAYAAYAYNVANPTAPEGPERIRSVRARITTRTAQPDRTVAIPLSPAPYPAGGSPFQAYMYRYYLPAGGPYPAPMTYARVRTVTTEVALVNQARNFY